MADRRSRRVGILGGTFNPPHVAHLVCAQEALSQLELDVVLLVPAAVPPHKEVEDDPGVELRWELCRAAAEDADGVDASRIELERPGPSFTVDTLRELNAREPEQELTLIVGGDMALDLPRWRDPEGMLELARLGVAERAEASRERIASRLARLRGGRDPDRVVFFDMPRLDVSSSDVRRRVRERRPIRFLVPDAVREAIEEHGLYGAGGGEAPA